MPWGNATTAARTASQLESLLQAGVVNVAEYGATGDGVTNDAVFIQAAIDAAEDADGGVVFFPGGSYLVNSPLVLPVGTPIALVGEGRSASTIIRGSNVIVIDMSGTATGTGNHCRRCLLQDLTVSGGYNTSWTAPLVRAYYSSIHFFERVNFVGGGGPALKAVEFWDSTFTNCRFEDCASGTGGEPAVYLLGRAASSGFGVTTDNCNVLNFVSCWWESNGQGSLWIDQNGGGVSNQIRVRDCKIEVSNMRAEPIYCNGVRSVHFDNLYGYIGGFGSGYTTATDFMYCTSMQDSSIDGLFFGQANTANLVRSAIAFLGGNQRSRIDRVTGDFPQNPTSAIVRFENSTNTVQVPARGVEYRQGTGAVFSGASDSPMEFEGTGTPEAAVSAVVGSRFWRTDGGASTTLYVKTSGSGNTGWTAK